MGVTRDVYKLVVEGDTAGAAASIRGFSATTRTELGNAKASVGQFASSLGTVGFQMAALGAAGTAALTAVGLAAKGAASETIALQRVAGGSAEQVSALRFAAQQTGTELGTLQTGVVRLSKAAASDKGAEKLAEYGIAARDSSGNIRPVIDLLNDVADAVKALPNGAEKNDLVTSIFGRGGASMIPLLNRGSDGLAELAAKAKDMGAIMSGDALESAKEYTKAQRDVAASMDALKISIGTGVVPVLTDVANLQAKAATGLAKLFASLPQGAREGAAAVGLVGSTAVSAVGGLASFGANAFLASQGVGKLAEAGIGLSSIATGGAAVALATVAVAGFGYAISENADQADRAISSLVRVKDLTKDLFDVDNAKRFRTVLYGIAEDIAGKSFVPASTNTVDKFTDPFVGGSGPFAAGVRTIDSIFGTDETKNKVELANKSIEALKRQLATFTADEAKKALTELRGFLIELGVSASDADKIINGLKGEIQETADTTTQAKTAFQVYADAVDAAAQKTVTLQQAQAGLRDGVDPGEWEVYADAVDKSLDPFLNLERAQKNYIRMQKQVADANEENARDMMNAWQRLADAKQALDEALKGDENGLYQESPEATIDRATKRLEDADRRLAANKQDAVALKDRDEALAEIERAKDRRQQLKRDEVQRQKRIDSAQRNVNEAEQNVQDTKKRNQDRIDNLPSALELADAGNGVISAFARVAGGLQDGDINLQAISDQLGILADQGLITPDQLELLRGRVGEMSNQAGIAGTAIADFIQALGIGNYSDSQAAIDHEHQAQGTNSPTFRQYVEQVRRRNYGIVEQEFLKVFAGQRAAGGVGFGGSMYRVNETGFESFQPAGASYAIPLRTGRFLNSSQTQRAMTAGQASGDSVRITINEQRAPRATAQAVAREMRADKFRRGKL